MKTELTDRNVFDTSETCAGCLELLEDEYRENKSITSESFRLTKIVYFLFKKGKYLNNRCTRLHSVGTN